MFAWFVGISAKPVEYDQDFSIILHVIANSHENVPYLYLKVV